MDYLNPYDDYERTCEGCEEKEDDKDKTFDYYFQPLLDMMYGKAEWNEWRFENTLEDLLCYFDEKLPDGELKIKEKIDNADLIKYFVSLKSPAINQKGV